MINQVARLLLLNLAFFLVGCSTLPPAKPDNICAIFDDKPKWYKAAYKAQKRWGSSIPTMMSIMYQESQFKHNARPARTKILWVLPGPRPSDAYGYPQAKDDVWDEYQDNSGNGWSRRDNFKDGIDFIGWYNKQSQLRSKIKLTDTYSLYLAYHEGHGGFNRGSYRKKPWLMSTAQKVASRASNYTQQLQGCEKRFQGSWWWPF
jgi:hypothetical protein